MRRSEVPVPQGSNARRGRRSVGSLVVIEAQVLDCVFAARLLLGAVLEGLLLAGHNSPKPRGTGRRQARPLPTSEGAGARLPVLRTPLWVKDHEGLLQQASEEEERRCDGPAPPGDATPKCCLRQVHAPSGSQGARSAATRPQART
ncbi:hypothetical protein NDU88_002705 [Pleurodeles waltl]|uniref:Uncharacterized protein n=1 Tax=Pleurodeles waltl TaxID=8319 RepID=A0AAV7UD50_PLEWA|nr:hypothetical protein NDU88_002705 [Pleurodeles waltl]